MPTKSPVAVATGFDRDPMLQQEQDFIAQFGSGFESDTVTRAPRDFKNSAEATPDLPRPTTSTRLLLSSIKFHCTSANRDTIKTMPVLFFPLCLSDFSDDKSLYRNFSVVSANSANTSDAIQKRTITFDSDQPSNSK